DDPGRTGPVPRGRVRRVPGVHPVDLPAGEQPPQGAHAGYGPGVPATARGGPAVLRQRGPPAGVVVDHRQGRGPALAAHGGRRPRVDHAGGERDLLGRGPAPLQPRRADLDDPLRRPDPGAARHALPPPAGAPHARGRPDRRPGGLPLLLDRATRGRRAPLPAAGRGRLARGARVAEQPRRAGLDRQPKHVAAMFDHVAAKYDRTNSVISLRRDRIWRRATRHALALRPAERVLDVGAGTGVSTVEFLDEGAYAVGTDISL